MYLIDDKPSAVRFPRGNGYGAEVLKDLFGTDMVNGELPARGTPLQIGKGRIVKKAETGKKYRVAVLSIGTRLVESVMAARSVETLYPDVGVIVADARFMKPLDEDLLKLLATQSDVLITVEEGSIGGFGSHVQQFLCDQGLLDNGTLKMRSMVIPDIWIEQGPQKDQYDIAGLNEVRANQTPKVGVFFYHNYVIIFYNCLQPVQVHIAAKIESLVNAIRQYKPRGVIDVKAENGEMTQTNVDAIQSYFQVVKTKPSGPSYDIA